MAALTFNRSSYEQIHALIVELRAYVERAGHRVHPNSRFAIAQRRLEQLCEFYRNRSIPDHLEARDFLTDAAGLWLLADAILSKRGTSLETSIQPRLRDLTRGDPLLAAAAPQSNARDLVFELVVASACDTFASDVRFGHPEPDVICRYKDTTWGVACKAAHVVGGHENFASQIRRAIQQIRDSEVDRGVVAINLSDVFPHARLIRHPADPGTFASYGSTDAAQRSIVDLVDRTAILYEYERVGLSLRFPETTDSWRVPCIAYCIFSTVIVGGTLGRFAVVRRHDRATVDEAAEEFCENFNRGIQSLASSASSAAVAPPQPSPPPSQGVRGDQ